LGSKIAPALAAGNTVVIKPSERAPLSAHLFAQAATKAGVPAGVINIIYGGKETGEALVSHDDVDMVTFTGGSETGRAIARAAELKRTSLELGGKSAAIVFDDANLDQASFQLTFGSFGLSGQACAAASRLLIQKGAYDAFVDKLQTTATAMAIGDPLDAGTMLGPLIDEASLERVETMVAAAKSDGATVVFGGERQSQGLCARGCFYKPTLLANVDAMAPIAQRELFGPVACAFSFDDAKAAMKIANATRYGLAASVWTSALKKAHRAAAALEAGYVWINAYGSIPYTTPFGGLGDSGHGRAGGRDALLAFTRLKNVYVQL
jgi:acyl-CoA reductase-like NAD-dependent aldehyde dehydrogenase